jgi:hypothetical protein
VQLEQPDFSSAYDEIRQFIISRDVVSNRCVKYAASLLFSSLVFSRAVMRFQPQIRASVDGHAAL